MPLQENSGVTVFNIESVCKKGLLNQHLSFIGGYQF